MTLPPKDIAGPALYDAKIRRAPPRHRPPIQGSFGSTGKSMSSSIPAPPAVSAAAVRVVANWTPAPPCPRNGERSGLRVSLGWPQ
jgi:hypothetical protein